MSESMWRGVAAGTVVVLAAAYLVCVVLGVLQPEQQLDVAELSLLGLAALAAIAIVRPDWLKRLRLFELLGFKVQLDELKEDIDGLRIVLLMLLPETERAHLLNLASGKTQEYRTSRPMRAELRRLRSLGLIRSLRGRTIGGESGMNDKETEYDLSDYVELTDAGKYCARRLEEENLDPRQA